MRFIVKEFFILFMLYSFIGWDANGDNKADKLDRVDGNATYTAVWSESPRHYTVTWVFDSDQGEISVEETYAYGSIPDYKGKPIEPSSKTFKDWSSAPSKVTQDVTYYAVYTKNETGSADVNNTEFEAAPGGTLTTTVSIENIANMTESAITVFFDADFVELVEISLSDNVVLVDQGNGYFIIEVSGLEGDGVYELCGLTFNINEGIEAGEYSIFTLASEDNLTNALDSLVIYQDGDVNGDGVVNTRDLAILRQYVVGKIELTDAQLYYANFYKDTELDGAPKINTRDIALLQQFIVGIIGE